MIGLPFLQPGDKPPCMENPTIFYDDSYSPSDEFVTRYTVSRVQDAEVLATCSGCPFRMPCLEWAVQHEEWGHWAGTSPKQRQQMRKQWDIRLKRLPSVSDQSIRAERTAAARRQRGLMYERNLRDVSSERIRALNERKYGREEVS